MQLRWQPAVSVGRHASMNAGVIPAPGSMGTSDSAKAGLNGMTGGTAVGRARFGDTVPARTAGERVCEGWGQRPRSAGAGAGQGTRDSTLGSGVSGDGVQAPGFFFETAPTA